MGDCIICCGEHLEFLGNQELCNRVCNQSRIEDKDRHWSQRPWVVILPLPLTNCVTLGSDLTSLNVNFLIYKREVIIVPISKGFYEN